MNISQAKQQVKDAIEAYVAQDDAGGPLLDPASQRPLFLVGAPGIGKTAIMSQIAAELGMGLVSYSMTHHTRQSALGLPFIVEQSYGDFHYRASEYTMSEIIASLYDYMRETNTQRGILFLDEINCVSETLYPSMLQFLQFKTFGKHKVPDGWVVVTAGNPPEYNRSVNDFDIVTLDRLKKIEVEPDFDAWKAYATANGVHPAVLTFLETKKECFYVVEASLEGKSFVTARGWDDLSKIIVAFEALGKAVDFDLIIQYVQNERIARAFATYYDLFSKYRNDYQIEGILAGDYSDEVLQRAVDAPFDERLSVIGLMLDSLCGDMREVNRRVGALAYARDALRAAREQAAAGDAEAAGAGAGGAAGAGGVDGAAGAGGVGGGSHDALSVMAARRDDFASTAQMRVAQGQATRAIRDADAEKLRVLNAVVNAAGSRAGAVGATGAGAVGAPGADAASDGAYEAMAACYRREVSAMREQAKGVEGRLDHAFGFIDRAFGDNQELLVFEAELTSRADAARFVSQQGCDSYFEHNRGMILSDRQRDLRRRIEDLGL